MDIDHQIALRLRSRRRLLGMTLQEVAELSDTSFQMVQKYELGMTRVSAARLWTLAQALRVEVGYFFESLEPRPRPAERAPGARERALLN